MWPLLFILSSIADDQASEKYCFSSAQKRDKVQQELKSILVPSDGLTALENCLVINMRPHRRELIQRFVQQTDPMMTVDFSSAELKRDPCRLQVEKIARKKKNNTSVSVNPFGGGASQKDQEISSTEIFKIQTLKDFELTSNQDVVKGECRFITDNRYEVNLMVRKDPKPLLPGAPAGSIIVLNAPAPPDQETSYLQTNLQLQRGEKIEIGSIVRKLRGRNHDVKSDPEARGNRQGAAANEKIYLMLE